MQCRLCGSATQELFHQKVLGRFEGVYRHCLWCDLIQAENPSWLDQAYSSSIAALDVGAIQRNLECADRVSFVAWAFQVRTGLDFGGGAGVLTRLMRDRGYDFRCLDPRGPNLFAQGFEGSLSDRRDLVTACEVWEHSREVEKDLEALFEARHRVVWVETLLHWGHQPGWWYYAPETGQHIAFFSQKTMDFIARRYGYRVVCGHSLSLFVREDVPWGRIRGYFWRKLVYRPRLLARLGTAVLAFWPRSGLGLADAQALRSRLLPAH